MSDVLFSTVFSVQSEQSPDRPVPIRTSYYLPQTGPPVFWSSDPRRPNLRRSVTKGENIHARRLSLGSGRCSESL